MMQESSDPDLNLQLLNDHGIYVIYKPPNFSNTEFLDKFERILHNVFLSKIVFTILYDPKFSPFPDYFEFRDFRDFFSR